MSHYTTGQKVVGIVAGLALLGGLVLVIYNITKVFVPETTVLEPTPEAAEQLNASKSDMDTLAAMDDATLQTEVGKRLAAMNASRRTQNQDVIRDAQDAYARALEAQAIRAGKAATEGGGG